MTRRVMMIGKCRPGIDVTALAAVQQALADIEPSEVVCTEGDALLLGAIRGAYTGPVGVHENYVDGFGADALPAAHEIAPRWFSVSSRICYRESSIAGSTALSAAKALNVNIVMGYTGRMGFTSFTTGYDGNTSKMLTGFEVGNLLDKRHQERGLQQGYGVLVVDGDVVKPEPAVIRRGKLLAR